MEQFIHAKLDLNRPRCLDNLQNISEKKAVIRLKEELRHDIFAKKVLIIFL